MKKNIPGILAMVIPFSLMSAELREGAGHEYDGISIDRKVGSDASELPAKLTVDPGKVVRAYDAAMLGLSYSFYGNDMLGIAKLVPAKPFPEISPAFLKAAAGVPLPLNRIWFCDDTWKMSLGPAAQREKHKSVPWAQPAIQVCGPAEIIKAILAIDPTARFDIVVELTDKTPVQAHEIAEFLMGSADTPWGQRRIESGIEHPVVPAIWELGNERDWSRGKIAVAEYVRLAKATMAAIRQVQPDATFAPHAATAPWTEVQAKQWREWHRAILAELAGDISHLAFHPYYHGYSLAYVETYLDVIRDDIAGSANPKIRIFISEHGKWPSGGVDSPEGKRSWYTTHALVGCLDVGEWLIRMLDRPEVGAMTMHACSAGPWGMFYADPSSGTPYATGLADLFRFFALVPFGGDVLKCELSGEGTDVADGTLSLAAAAIGGPDGKLFLLLNNRLPDTSRTVSLNLPGGPWTLAERHVFTGPEMDSVNTLTDRPLAIRHLPGDPQELRVAKIPGRSLTLLVLSPRP